MKSKSYITLAVPRGSSQKTDKLLTEVSKTQPGFDVKTVDAEDGIYRCLQVYVHNNDSVAVIGQTKSKDVLGGAIFSEVDMIIYRLTERDYTSLD
jgi:hypothetical protein